MAQHATDDHEIARFDFRIGDAFSADDPIARYLMRLSMALGDLRVAVEMAVRPEQESYERMYFVRLTASHLHEVALLFNPPDPTIPPVEDLIRAAVPASDKATRKQLRNLHREVKKKLAERLPLRPEARLGREVKRLRNGFFHYHHDALNEPTLIEAMRQAADTESSYVVRERTLRANYADEVANRLMHPWAVDDETWLAWVHELHDRIIELMGTVSEFMHLAEATYLHTRPAGAVRVTDHRSR
jgi:hypothetical protein